MTYAQAQLTVVSYVTHLQTVFNVKEASILILQYQAAMTVNPVSETAAKFAMRQHLQSVYRVILTTTWTPQLLQTISVSDVKPPSIIVSNVRILQTVFNVNRVSTFKLETPVISVLILFQAVTSAHQVPAVLTAKRGIL